LSGDDAEFPWTQAEKDLMAGIDTSAPVSARIWNYWMGGKDFYAVDKRAGDEFTAIYPGIVDMARAARYFLARTVRYLAAEAGVRQFLDIGTGLPSHDSTHEIAQSVAPSSRVVYVDNDPLVMAHAQALLTGIPKDSTDYIDGDLNDPRAILAIARTKLDFSKPVAIMLMGILGHIGPPGERDETALAILERLKAALPSGGYLVVREATDTVAAHNDAIRGYNGSGAAPFYLRSPEQIVRFFDGLEPVEPGIVPISRWRPEASPFADIDTNAMGGVALKP
jgi:hypothetical protein